MGLFSFSKRKESVILIDIGSASVGGAYAHFEEKTEPIIYYTVRVPVTRHADEELTASMLRALKEVEQHLIEEGAPAMKRETGSGHADRILVSVGAPWQETQVVSESIQQARPFTFTHALLDKTTAAMASPSEGRIESGRAVIATVLNGYETSNPFGKQVKRADIVLLASSIDKEASRGIEKSLRSSFHNHNIALTAFAPAAYGVLRDLYPHQKDFIVLDVAGAATDAAFVKRGILAGVSSVPHGLDELRAQVEKAGGALDHQAPGSLVDPMRNKTFGEKASEAEKTWLLSLREVFADFAGKQALPRTVFLLAENEARGFLRRTLEESELRSLWLSDEPLSIIPIEPSHLSSSVKTRGVAEGDLFLGLLALFHRKEFDGSVTRKEA